MYFLGMYFTLVGSSSPSPDKEEGLKRKLILLFFSIAVLVLIQQKHKQLLCVWII